jgi:hypothetical protein
MPDFLIIVFNLSTTCFIVGRSSGSLFQHSKKKKINKEITRLLSVRQSSGI